MKKYLFAEIICVVLSVSFIFYSVADSFTTDKTAAELSEEIVSLAGEDIVKRNDSFTAEKFDIDLSVFSSFIYYSSDDVMNVNELFIGVFADNTDSTVADIFSDYAEGRYNLFNGYAPRQAEYLKNRIIEIKSGAVIFCVGENADAVFEHFVNSL